MSNQKNQQQMALDNDQQEVDEDHEEGEDDDKLLIELDDLDENERQLLL
jgi:hypothetical protein